ncbi:hypothetical protein Moror_9867 [Moniliophthora roreri MCA 2997]|uniref:Uncharacterized protein n=1 Tax=Moniliophthora roreri (strain MCA 2997) TaxID=1381753 RepID=V2X1Y7_MONRO|nr:hypothetical protein Moror_9867 [Moniliophthora roreri MCA 2997]
MSNSSVTEEDIGYFASTTNILVKPMANFTVMFYIHGIYTVLFIISLHILICRQDRPNRVLYMLFTIVLFTLTSAYNAVQTFGYASQATLEFTFIRNQDWASFLAFLQHNDAKTIILGFEMVLPLCLVTMADLMLLHRCYVIWGSSKWIAFPFIFMVLSLAICEIVASAFVVIDTAFWLADMGVNIILTLLTAGRIWWIAREARKYLGPAIKTKYNTIIAIILESGILYPIFVIAGIVYSELAYPEDHGSTPFDLLAVSYQIAGIAPTLIIIRAASGKTVEYTNANQAMSSLHFANGAAPGSTNSNTRPHVQTVDIEARVSVERIHYPDEGNSV